MYRVGLEEDLTHEGALNELADLAIDRFDDLEGGCYGPNGRPCYVEVTVTLRELGEEEEG